MTNMLKLPSKKSASYFSLKKQIHSSNMPAEKAKEKHFETHKKNRTLSIQFNQNSIAAQEINPETTNINLELLDDPDGPAEGFFPCPFCTCWFVHKKNLDSHIKKWCDRSKSNMIFITQTK